MNILNNPALTLSINVPTMNSATIEIMRNRSLRATLLSLSTPSHEAHLLLTSRFSCNRYIPKVEEENRRIIFPAFSLMVSVFNSINARKLNKTDYNVFKGILGNWYYIFIQSFIIVGQMIMVTF